MVLGQVVVLPIPLAHYQTRQRVVVLSLRATVAGMIQSILWNGRSIRQPGCYEGVNINLYHSQLLCSTASVSSSNLRRALTLNGGSPAHFYSEWTGNPERVEEPDSEAFILGRAAHHLLLGQPNFAREFAVRPDEWRDWRTAAAREWRDEQVALGKTPLTPDQVEHVKGMAVSLGRNSLIRTGILNGLIERSIVWYDKATDLWIKARPDAIPTDSGDFSDLKTTISVQWRDLARTITDYGYAQQAALTRTVVRNVLNMEMSSWALVFVEKKPPYCVRVVQLRTSDIDLGERLNTLALRAIRRGIDTGEWPGPAEIDGQDGAYIDLVDSFKTRATEAVNQAEAAAARAP